MSHQLTTPKPNPVPTELGSPQSKLVYLYLDVVGAATADELTDVLAMKKLSILTVLRSLSNEGLVEKDGERFSVAR